MKFRFKRRMAGSNGTPNNSHCKKYKSKVILGIKCINCDNCFHPNCAKMKNLKVVDDNLVIYCEKVDQNIVESDTAFFDALEVFACDDNKVDINFVRYIVNQKDELIKEMRNKINILNKQIVLLKRIQSIYPTNSNTVDEINKKWSDSAKAQKPNQPNLIISSVSNTGDSQTNYSKFKNISSPSLQEVQRDKMNTTINLSTNVSKKEEIKMDLNRSEVSSKKDSASIVKMNSSEAVEKCSDANNWNVVNRQRKCNIVVGNNTTEIVKSVPKHSYNIGK
ncbi:unnamed protein product [Psylliodes chrysocephalus]|uniref:Uncharacterized protein n=1 Tax=Psylliodes chrysocephalus TaxID=3402493 RepID=A0A9P0CIX4_9CUCU|nr:unnamed protein product [Psylliodes chrysocephala]